MDLFEQNENGFWIRNFSARPVEVTMFRNKELETIPKEERIYYFATNQKNLFDSFCYDKNGIYGYKDLNYTKKHLFKQNEIAKLNPYDSVPSRYGLKVNGPSSFYHGYRLSFFDREKTKKVVSFEPEENKYFIVAGEPRIFDENGNIYTFDEQVKNAIYCVDGLISLTKPLYLFHQLLNGNITKVVGEDIDEQLSIFHEMDMLSTTGVTISKEKIIEYAGWGNLSKEQIEKNLSSHQVVLQKIRNKN